MLPTELGGLRQISLGRGFPLSPIAPLTVGPRRTDVPPPRATATGGAEPSHRYPAPRHVRALYGKSPPRPALLPRLQRHRLGESNFRQVDRTGEWLTQVARLRQLA